MGLGKSKKLRTTFIEYLVSLGALIIALLVVNYFILTSIVMYPANYSEKIIQTNYEELRDSPKVKIDLLTPMSSFGVYSEDGNFLYGNFPSKNKKSNWASYSKGNKLIGLSNYITSIEREKDILIINYPLTMQFKSEILRRFLPNAEVTAVILFLLQVITIIALWANRFAKKINSGLIVLLKTMEKIQEQNLDFNIDNSNIEEINAVLKGIEKMKNSLKIALLEQWLLEKQKREQVSALAHDIKTPLTIVKGYAELLKETELMEEQNDYCNSIKESSEQMDEYIQMLLSITKGEVDKKLPNENVKVTKILNSLKSQSEALSKTKAISMVWKIDIEEYWYIKGNELERAVMNIIKNAFDFAPNGSNIAVYGISGNSELTIKVIDQGNGFSEKMLKYGREQFFMGNESRTKSRHHGLGLYIANTIITNYNGELILSNDEKGGGLVTVKIPILQKMINQS